MFLVVSLLLSLMPAPAGHDAQAIIDVFDGDWIPVEAELDGVKFPEDYLKSFKLTCKDGQYTVTVGTLIDIGTFKIIPSQKIKAMDLVGIEGPNKGKTFLAIYELKGEFLRMVYDLDAKQRPTEFKTVKGDRRFMVNYKRVKGPG